MTHPSQSDATSEDRAALRAVRQALLALHKILLDRERLRYEREHGRIESTHQHLQLVMEHPMFVWLRPLSALIVRFDERLGPRSTLSASDVRELAADARALTTIAEPPSDFQQRYRAAIEEHPDVLAAHASVARTLAPLVGPHR